MLKRGISSVENAREFCKFVSEGKNINSINFELNHKSFYCFVDEICSPMQFKTLVAEINREISTHSFKLVFKICEVTDQEVIVWINIKNDHISTLQGTFTVLELQYFHVILQEILNSDEHRITSIVCLNLTSTLTGALTRSHGQKLLDKWINIGYYIKKGGDIYLGPRLIIEFNAYLKSHSPDAVCNLCSELVFTVRLTFDLLSF